MIAPQPATPNLPRPVGAVSTASIDELERLAGAAIPGSASARDKRRRSVRRFATHLAEFPGATWQDRWLASGWEQPGRLIRTLNPPKGTGWSMTSGFKTLAAMRVIVPSARAMRLNAIPDYFENFRVVQRDPLLDEVAVRIAPSVRATATSRSR